MRKRAVSGPSGRFVLSDLSEGEGTLRVEAPGFLEWEKTVSLGAGETLELQIVLDPAGTVRGKVTDRRGAPIVGARVRLESDRSRRGGRRGGPPFRRSAASALTDENGMWVLPLARAGPAFRVRVSHPDYITELSEPFSVEDPSADGPFLEIVLSQGAVLSGVVLGPDGSPLAGIRVQVRRDASRSRGGGSLRSPGPPGRPGRPLPPWAGRLSAASRSAVSDSEGHWKITALRKGAYDLWVDQAGFAPYRDSVELGKGEEKEVEIRLEKESWIRGTVVDGGSVPIPGASVTVSGDGVSRHVYSDQDGLFTARGLKRGSIYDIFVRAEGFLPYREMGVPAPQENFLCRLVAPASVGGVVLSSATREPVRPIRVTLKSVDAKTPGVPGPREFNTEDGSFLVEGVPPGTYTLIVEAKRFPPSRVEDLVLEEGAAVDDLEIIMDEGLTVAGVVLTPKGKPAAGAVVTAQPVGTTNPKDAKKRKKTDAGPAFRGGSRRRGGGRSGSRNTYLRAGVTQADKAGRFTVRGLGPGRYVLTARHDDWAPVRSKPFTVSEEDPPPKVNLRLNKGLSLEVEVLLPDGSRGKGVTVTIQGPDKQLMRRTDSNGKVRFTGLSNGKYTLRAYLDRSTASQKQQVVLSKKDAAVTISAWRRR